MKQYEVALISDFIPPLSTRHVYVEATSIKEARERAIEQCPWIVVNISIVTRATPTYGGCMTVEYAHGATRRMPQDSDLIRRLGT